MQCQTYFQSIKKSQLGASLLELLTVISIIGIIAYISLPNYSEVLSFKDLNTAKTTLIQSLNRAKNIAGTQSTIVTVSLSNNQIKLKADNTASDQTIKLPGEIKVSESVTFKFNSMGETLDSTENKLVADTQITIQSSSNSNVHKKITVTTMGLIVELPDTELTQI